MSVTYAIKEGLSAFRKAKLAALGSIITIAISLLLLGLFYVIAVNTSRVISGIQERVEMEVFLEQPASTRTVDQLRAEILAIPGVADAQFISKDEAARIFKREFGEDIGTVLEFNPLPSSFKITLEEPARTSSRAEEIHQQVAALNGVETVIYRRDMLEFIEKQARTLYLVGLALGLLIAVSAIFLVSNTIRLTIYAKRKAVQTMKLVGASRWFVRFPFVIEGLVQGALGGAIAAGILYYSLSFATAFVSPDLAQFVAVGPSFYGMVVVVGIGLGLFGSMISVRKFITETVAN